MSVKVIECPRDAMQGMEPFIPTATKTAYINQLLRVGFDTIDFGSFVSPKAIPQLRDTAEVLKGLELDKTQSKLLAIIANRRGAEDACSFPEIDYLGYPFSISETFQLRNTNATIDQSLSRVEEIQSLCKKHDKQLVIYISMAFGNPYDDPWSPDLAASWAERLHRELEIRVLALADTVGVSNEENIGDMFSTLIPAFPSAEIGAHLHSTPEDTMKKVQIAYAAGCRRFDAAIKGYGGCPMAEDELVGNVATEQLLKALPSDQTTALDREQFDQAIAMSAQTFPL